MKAKVTAGLLAALLAFTTATPAAPPKEPAATSKEPAQKPALTLDPSPVNVGKTPVVTTYADIVEVVQQAVVSVYSTKFVHARESKEKGLGSGVIVSPNGYVLTNNHVVEGADELSISLPDGREFKAKVIGTDPKTDIAVLKIDADHLPILNLADSDKLRVGDIVFAIGNPLGIGQTVTMGIVSAKGRNNLGLLDGVHGYENFIQTDAAINMGNSGGALVDAKGRLIGINSAIVSTTHGNIGIGLAIPINFAASIMTSLTETGSVTRGYLGISVDPIDSKTVAITNVTPGSPADKAGLKRSDAILAIDNKPVASVQDLRLLVSQIPPDTEIAIRMVREGKEQTLKAKLGRLTDDNAQNELIPGVEITPLTGELRRRLALRDRIDGLVITTIDPNSPYFDRLVPGMIISEINRQPVPDVETARQLLQPGRNLFFIYNRGLYRYLVVTK